MTRLIALYSSNPGSGKTTAALRFSEQGWIRAPFAAPMKRMLASLLSDAGYSSAEIGDVLNREKSHRLSLLPGTPTGRHLLQTLGTEWGRELIHPHLWIHLWESRVKGYLEAGSCVVCDDLRTKAEAEAVCALGGELWRICRPGAQLEQAAIKHPTEGALDHLCFRKIIANDGELAELNSLIDKEIAR